MDLLVRSNYFNYATGLTMTNQKFADFFGQTIEFKTEKLTQFHMDIAASIQKVTEEIVKMTAHCKRI